MKRFFNRSLFESTSVSVSDPNAWSILFGGEESNTGEQVTEMRALMLAPVWQAVDMISGDVSILPLQLKEIDADDGFKSVVNNKINRMVSLQANREQSASECWKRVVFHALLWGNGYIWAPKNALTGIPDGEMFNLLPDRTIVDRDDNGQLQYITEIGNTKKPIPKEEIIHIKGLSYEQGIGLNLTKFARETFGLALAANGYNAKFFRNGMQSGGILEIPVSTSQKSKDNLEEGFTARTGKENWFKTMVLRDGAKFHSTTIDPERGQLHELREDQVREIARYFKLPSFKLNLQDAAAFNSSEQAQIVYLTSTLEHWLHAIASECRIKLLTIPQKERGTHTFEHDVTKLLRTDAKTQAEIYQVERSSLVRTGNEWRREIGLMKSEDENANKLLNPNTLDRQGEESNNESDTDDTIEENRLVRQVLITAVDSASRAVIYRVQNLSKNPKRFLGFIDDPEKTDLYDTFKKIGHPYFDICENPNLGYAASKMIRDVIASVSKYTEHPYKTSELRQNILDWCSMKVATLKEDSEILVDSLDQNEN